MSLVRRIARPLLASIFIAGGIDAFRNPAPRAEAAEPVASPLTKKLNEVLPVSLPEDTAQLVRINAGVQVGAGALLALSKFPRLAALTLAGSIVATTAGGHRFWEEAEPASKRGQRVHFLKNLGLLGGLLLAAVDTDGKPSLGWRASHAAQRTASQSKRARRTAKREAKLAKKALPAG